MPVRTEKTRRGKWCDFLRERKENFCFYQSRLAEPNTVYCFTSEAEPVSSQAS